MEKLLELTLVELTEVLRARKASPIELMEATLRRIDETHGELNAVVKMRDRQVLLEEARAAEQRIMRNEARPLEGIPLGVKDLEDVAGMITFCRWSLPVMAADRFEFRLVSPELSV